MGLAASKLRMTAPAAGGGGLPVSSPVAWYDASDTSTISDTAGAVDQFSDKGTSGADLTASGAARPTTGSTVNGLNAILFGGTAATQALVGAASLTATTDLSIYVVVTADASTDPSTVPFFIGDGSANGYGPALRSDASPVGYLRGGLAWVQGSTTAPTSGTHLMTLIRGASTWDMRYDGAFEVGGTGSVNTPTATRIGSHAASGGGVGFLDGKFCEGLAYSGAHSTTDRDAMETYLADKWGITL